MVNHCKKKKKKRLVYSPQFSAVYISVLKYSIIQI